MRTSPQPRDLPALQLVDLVRITPTPWRNGGGRTRELLAWPAVDDWVVRVSVAEIEQDGPFSSFPGIDRHFAVLTGAGVQLDVAGVVHTLEPGSPPLAFPGEAAPGCALLDGPTRDLNLMVRRRAGCGALVPAVLGREERFAGSFVALYAATSGTLRLPGGAALEIDAHHLLWTAEGGGQRWAFDSPAVTARAWWLWFAGAA